MSTDRPSNLEAAGPPCDGSIGVADWGLLVATNANALIVGEDRALMQLLLWLWPTFAGPVCRPGRSLELLPKGGEGTVVLDQAHAWTVFEQRRLLDWSGRCPGLRVITTASRDLRSLVEAGLWLDDLYYRLNVLTSYVAGLPVAARGLERPEGWIISSDMSVEID